MATLSERSQTADRRGGVHLCPLLNSGDTGPTFTKSLHNVARSSTLDLLKSELRYSTPFRNTKATNEGKVSRPISPMPWLLPWSDRIKRVKSVIFDQNCTTCEYLVKIGPVNHEIICLKCLV